MPKITSCPKVQKEPLVLQEPQPLFSTKTIFKDSFEIPGEQSSLSKIEVVRPPEIGTVLPAEKLVFEWRAKKATWRCPFFPQQEQILGGDPIFNLYADGGALEKFDKVFQTQSKKHEYAYYRISCESDRKKYGWWEHCDLASAVACLLPQPIRGVNKDGVFFTPHDISGLLCKSIDNLYVDMDFIGQRRNWNSAENLAPTDFLSGILKAWCQPESTPFVLNIGPLVAEDDVQNRPFDHVKLFESKLPPQGTDESRLGLKGEVTFYRAELVGTGFEKDRRNYCFFIDKSKDGAILGSEWLAGKGLHSPPDFAWRPKPKGNLLDGQAWQTMTSYANNPQVKPNLVWELFEQSI